MNHLHYDHRAAIAYAESRGLKYNYDDADNFDAVAHAVDLSQAQFDEMLRQYSHRMAFYFDPCNYPVGMRFKIAFGVLAIPAWAAVKRGWKWLVTAPDRWLA